MSPISSRSALCSPWYEVRGSSWVVFPYLFRPPCATRRLPAHPHAVVPFLSIIPFPFRRGITCSAPRISRPLPGICVRVLFFRTRGVHPNTTGAHHHPGPMFGGTIFAGQVASFYFLFRFSPPPGRGLAFRSPVSFSEPRVLNTVFLSFVSALH